MPCCRRRVAPLHVQIEPRTALKFEEGLSEHNPGMFQEACFLNSRRMNLRAYRTDPVGEPKGIVVMHHGIRGHALYTCLRAIKPGARQTCFEGSIAEMYVSNGYVFYTYDCEGHGLSDSRHETGFFSDASDLVTDLLQFTAMVRKEHPDLRLFASGLSMGGGICVGAAIKHPAAFDGIILAAPMVSVEQLKKKGINPCLIAVAPTLLRCCPCGRRLRLVAMAKNPNPLIEKTFDEDPLTDSKSKMLVGPSFASMNFCNELVKQLDQLTVPFLAMHARADNVTDFESSTLLMERAVSSDKTLLEPPDGTTHAIFGEEVSRDWAKATTLEWLRQRT